MGKEVRWEERRDGRDRGEMDGERGGMEEARVEMDGERDWMDQERSGLWAEPAPSCFLFLRGTLKNPRTVNSDLTFQAITKG